MSRRDHQFIREFRDLSAQARLEGELSLLAGTALFSGAMMFGLFLAAVVGGVS